MLMGEIVLIVLTVALAGALYYIYRLRVILEQRQRTVVDLRRESAERKRDSTQSNVLFSTVCNVAYDLVIVLDEGFAVTAISKSARILFDTPNPIGEKLDDAVNSPELVNIAQNALRYEDELIEEQLTIGEHIYRTRTQVMRYNTGRFIGLALQDITQLVQLNRARRDMVANISHELRTPIANIRLIIDSLFHEQDKPKRKDSISSLHDIARETDSLLWLVQELLDLSMIESGQALLRMVEMPLVELVEETAERMADQSTAKDLQLNCHIPKKLKVLCDPDQTKRVLVNLVHNAIKWSPDGETITINASRENGDVTISVLDNGPGVPDEKCGRIFERFYQVEASRTGNEGTGLGLAICKHIVEAHGGRIWAEGNSNGGGRFRFTLLGVENPDTE